MMELLGVALRALFQFLVALLLALLEVEIEGPHGWAVKLPTWRWGPEWWLKLTNGKPLTGYHACLLSLLVLLFHWPLFGAFSWRAEARTMSVFFQTVFAWDLLWFLLNPAFGWRNFKPGKVWWFRRWLGPFPTDYYFSAGMAFLLAWLSGDLHYRTAEFLLQVPLVLAAAASRRYTLRMPKSLALAAVLLSLPAAAQAQVVWTGGPSLGLFRALPRSEAPDIGPGRAVKAIEVSPEEMMEIGRRIWHNECGGTVEGLTSWNEGETFASLGIGHFIWYPAGQEGPFEESFPKLLAHLQRNGVALPDWLAPGSDCPWPTRQTFLKDLSSPRMKELRRLLADNVPLQARFIIDRLEASLPRILETLPAADQPAVKFQFYSVANAALGSYALADYVNFKGEGLNPKERYKGQGWGLLQVLQGMKGTEPGAAALKEYSESAARVLERRVANSPPERNEQRWLPGWLARVKTYRAD